MVLNTKNIHIINVRGTRNKGDLAMLKSTISELKRISPNVNISLSSQHIDQIKQVFPEITVLRPLIDSPVVTAGGSEKKRKNIDKKGVKYKVIIVYHIIITFLQILILLISILLSKLNLKPFYRPEVINRLQNVDIVIFGGGEGFKDGSESLPKNIYNKQMIGWISLLFVNLCIFIAIRKGLNKPILIFPQSIGPFKSRIGRLIIKYTLNLADEILIRDIPSAKYIENLGINNKTSMVFDIAFLFKGNFSNLDILSIKSIGVCPGLFDLSYFGELKDKYILTHAKTLDYLIEKHKYHIYFLPSNVGTGLKYDDLKLSELIFENMVYKNNVKIMSNCDIDDYKNLLCQMDFLIASRMHPCIIASSCFVPFISIIHDHKQIGFLKNINMEQCGIMLDCLSEKNLIEKAEYLHQNRDQLNSQLRKEIPLLQHNIRTEIDRIIIKYLN